MPHPVFLTDYLNNSERIFKKAFSYLKQKTESKIYNKNIFRGISASFLFYSIPASFFCERNSERVPISFLSKKSNIAVIF